MNQGRIERQSEEFHKSWSLPLAETILSNLELCANSFHFGHNFPLSHLVLDRKRVVRADLCRLKGERLVWAEHFVGCIFDSKPTF